MNSDYKNYYVINSAIYNDKAHPEKVDEEAVKIITKATELAGQGRKIAVVLGINAPESTKDFPNEISDSDMKKTTARIKKKAEELTKEAGNDVKVYVVHYRWERFDDRLRKDGEFKANERINYVAIRNNLFYSAQNQEAVNNFINEAKNKDNSYVKLFALDGDSEITKERVEELENYWRSQMRTDKNGKTHLPPLITTGYYQFEIDEKQKKLHEIDGNCNWGLFLASIENKVDLDSKKKIGSSKFEGKLLYKRFNLPKRDSAINSHYILARTQKLQKNLFLLDKNPLSIDKEKQDLLKIHICDVLCVLKEYKQSLKDKSLEGQYTCDIIHKQIVSSLREIEKLESSFENIEDLKHDFMTFGKQVLYPSENVMFVSLYDKMGNKEFNVFDEMQRSVKGEADKVRKLWGDEVGREEGEHIASQMKKYWESLRTESPTLPHEMHLKHEWMKQNIQRKIDQTFVKERDVVDFTHIFRTTLPARSHRFLTDKQKALGESLPKSLEEVRELCKEIPRNLITLSTMPSNLLPHVHKHHWALNSFNKDSVMSKENKLNDLIWKTLKKS